MAERSSAECNSHETHNLYPNLHDQRQFRLNKINGIKYYFVAEIKERELMSKRLSKYIASFDYFDKSLIVLSVTTDSISIASFATVLVLHFLLFFSAWVFFHEHSRITRLQEKREGISLTPYYHFYPLHRHLDVSGAVTAGRSPLHIASRRTRTGNLWFPSASR